MDCLARSPAPMVQLVFADLAAQRISVYAQDHRGARLIAFGALEHTFDEALLKFAHGLIKQYAALHHLPDKPFQLISHVFTLPTM
jgi:hypothetical protein